MSVISEGGPVMMVVAGLGGLGALVALGLTALGIGRKRVPLAAWMLVPLLALTAGAAGAWMQAGEALGALEAAPSIDVARVAKDSFAAALLPDWFGRVIGAALMGLACWGAGLGAVARSDEDTRGTWGGGIMAILASFFFAAAICGYTFKYELGTSGYYLGGLLAVAGTGVGIGAMRRHLHDHAFRVAGMRFASGLSLIFAISWAGKALILGNHIELSAKLAQSAGADYATVLEAGVLMGDSLGTLTWIALVGAWIVAMFGFFAELGDVVQKGTLFDMIGVFCLLFVAMGVRMVESTATDSLSAIGSLEPLAMVMGDRGYDLPSSLNYNADGDIQDARPLEGGFGDVFVYIDGNCPEDPIDPDCLDGWFRQYAWTGMGWDLDDPVVPLAKATPNASRETLIVMNADGSAEMLFEMLEKTGGKGLLLGRMDELPETDNLELKARGGTYLSIEVADINFAEEYWLNGDSGRIHDGPIRRYGKGWDERKMYQQLAAAFAEVPPVEGEEAVVPKKGLNIVVGPRTRMRNVFDECIPAITSDVDGKFVGNERYCHISQVEVPEPEEDDKNPVTHVDIVQEMAMTDFVAPKVDNLRMSIKMPKELEADITKIRIDREIGAFSYCGTTAALDVEVKGRLQMKIYVNMRGRLDSIMVGERSQVEAPEVIDCVRKRIGGLKFTPHEIEDAEKMPFIELNLSYR